MYKAFTLLMILAASNFIYCQTAYNGQTIEQILELPEEEINMYIACFVMAKEAYPVLKIEPFE